MKHILEKGMGATNLAGLCMILVIHIASSAVAFFTFLISHTHILIKYYPKNNFYIKE